MGRGGGGGGGGWGVGGGGVGWGGGWGGGGGGGGWGGGGVHQNTGILVVLVTFVHYHNLSFEVKAVDVTNCMT